MSFSHNRSSPTLPRTSPAWRPNLSRAARRGIRQAAAIARKEDFHSFRVHADNTVTWTIRHEKPVPGKPKPDGGEGGDSREREPSKRVLRSRARAAAEETARARGVLAQKARTLAAATAEKRAASEAFRRASRALRDAREAVDVAREAEEAREARRVRRAEERRRGGAREEAHGRGTPVD